MELTRIPEQDRDMMEKAIYLPMVLTVLAKDLTVIENSPFKLKDPYKKLIRKTMEVIQKELYEVKKYMNINQLKVYEVKRDEAFTMYSFLYKGYEEHHNYFNPRIRNKVQEIMEDFFKRDLY